VASTREAAGQSARHRPLRTSSTASFDQYEYWRKLVLPRLAVLIAAAYFSIPITLLYFARKKRDLAFHSMFVQSLTKLEGTVPSAAIDGFNGFGVTYFPD
jgi:hypothetical protein